MLGQLRRTAETDSRLTHPADANLSARLDQGTLEFGNARQQSRHQSTMRRRGVTPSICQRAPRASSALRSCGRSDLAPLCFSANIRVALAAFNSAIWLSNV